MTGEILIFVGIIIFLIFLTGFFSASETGLTVANRARLHKLATDGNRRAQKALKLREDKDGLIGSLLLGFNLCSIIASMLAATVAGMLFIKDGEGLVVATAVMAFLLLVFGEIIPKTIAFNNADKVAIAVAPIWVWLVKIMGPVTKILHRISLYIMRGFGYKVSAELVDSIDTLRGTIDLQHSEGKMKKEDRDMLGSILDLSEVEVGKIMIHRTDMTTLNIAENPKEIIHQAVESQHTRLPIWENNEENIIGILNTKDVLRLDRENPTTEEIRSLLHEVEFIPETTSLRSQLKTFRKTRRHMAMVVDEYGALLGLITLEDILEEIVGQINDEHDKAAKGIKLRDDGTIRVKGTLSIRDLNREMSWNLPAIEDASTVAGFVIGLAERIPEVGEKYRFKDLEFKIVRKEKNQITRVRIRKIEKKSGNKIEQAK